MALATLCMQWRSSVRYTRLGESLPSSNGAVQNTLDQMTQYFATTQDPALAPRLALAHIARLATQEATFTAALDYFVVVAAFASVCLARLLAHATWQTIRPPASLMHRRRFSAVSDRHGQATGSARDAR
ncbi:hypothetical protein WKW80_17005 [Variovorax humicola]|uniref:Uncharacterized protein n=1 Tax=Variovorax humicola TaxID=1769758 RepID=A0ABU8W2I6_9BURK